MTILKRISLIAKSVADFFSKIPAEIKDTLDDVLPIVQLIENALKSKTAIELTEVMPGTWDDKLRLAAISLIDEFLAILKATESAASTETVHEFTRQMTLQKMASTLTALKDNNELPQNRYDMYSQIYFSGKVKK